MKALLHLTQSLIILSLLAACSLPLRPAASPTPNAVATLAGPTAKPGTAHGKPNIIFILSDDLNSEEYQYMPQLKALIADQGVTFSNYFVPDHYAAPHAQPPNAGSTRTIPRFSPTTCPWVAGKDFITSAKKTPPSPSGCRALDTKPCWPVNT